MKQRIQPPAAFEELLDRLVDKDRVFQTKAKALLFAASVGFVKHRVETPEDFDRGEAIRLNVFAEDEEFIHALAVAAHDQLDVLSLDRQPDRVILFEQYAFLGLPHLQRVCYGDPRPEHPVEGLLHLFDELDRPPGEVLPGLDDVF